MTQKIRPILLALVLSTCLPGIRASAFTILGVDIVDYGIYAMVIDKTVPTDTTVAGERSLIHQPQVIAKTYTIPATRDMMFGYHFVIKGRPFNQEITITCRIVHPPMRNPETGKTGTEGSYQTNYLIGTNGFIGFRFGQAWELVPGRYVMTVSFEGQRLLEQAFTVYVPTG